jgi:hypothetical protein
MAIGVELAAVGVELIPGIAGADNITVGTSTITGGTDGRVLYDNAGLVGEKTVTGTGSVVLQSAASPTGVWTMASATAAPAGGSTSARLLFGTTSGFGIYYGSGAPTVTAAKGSLYLRSDGSGVNDRAYINTDGSTTWTAVVTVA